MWLSHLLLHRPARLLPEPVPDGELVVHAPPQRPGRSGTTLWLLLFPVLTVVGTVAFVLYNPSPVFLVIAGVVVVASLIFGSVIVVQMRSANRRRAREEASRYLDYLDGLAARADRTARLQSEAGRFVHPRTPELWAVACRRLRVWERSLDDRDFARARIGTGTVPLATPIRMQEEDGPSPPRNADSEEAARTFIEQYGQVAGQPVTLDLRAHASVSLVGPRAITLRAARAVATELATFCSSDELRIGVCHAPESAGEWEFAKWLPHVVTEDGDPLICDNTDRLVELLGDEVVRRRDRARRRAGLVIDDSGLLIGPNGHHDPRPLLLLVIDGCGPSSPIARSELVTTLTQHARELEAAVLSLTETQTDEPRFVDARVRVALDGRFVLTANGDSLSGRLEDADPAICGALARRLAPLKLGKRASPVLLAETWRLADLLGVSGVDDLQPERTWRERPVREWFRVPLGVGADGEPVVLDLKEPALGGMGPHGMIIGATGSGKSELLRTITTGLAVTHPPELLGMVLVDFKGGATFAGMADLPQVAGLITNLQSDLALVDRVHDALIGEQLRRQELLRGAGNLQSIRDYHRLLAERGGMEPLPFLLVIVDEFGELLASRPDFIDLFVAIGRVGRSLGMHLLLASQRLEEGRLRGLESHLSYRIALRVFSPIESRQVIGVPDAYTLPQKPGSAYLRVDPDAPRRFKVASASTPLAPDRRAERAGIPTVQPFTARSARRTEPPGPPPADDDADGLDAASLVRVVVRRLAGVAPRAHQVWLPPLEHAVTLDRLLPELQVDGERGLAAGGWPGTGRLSVPLGLVDRPREQVRDVYVADFEGAAGHLAIVGAPLTGKSTLLRTLLLSFALTHTPIETQFYAIDFGGGGLQSLEGLPHVGTVCGRFDPERTRRVVSELCSLLERRERFFRTAGVESMDAFRALRHADTPQKEVFGDVFLLVDNWGAVRQELDDVEPGVLDIASRGLGYGIHLVLTANRWMEVRSPLRDNIGGRLELRLNEPIDSDLDRRMAAAVPAGVPGRGVTRERLLFQAALPRTDGRATADGLQAALDELVRRSAGAWSGPVTPPARVLPRQLPLSALPAPGADSREGVPVGVAEPALEVVNLDLTSGDSHFLVFGDGESGKTNFCRAFLAGLVARSSPGDVAIAVIDYRRTLLDAVPDPFLWSYAGGPPAAAGTVDRLCDLLTSRVPGPNLSAAQLRQRSWWSGPEIYLVVDDYDLVVSPGGLNPLVPLMGFLAQGRDLGFHVLVTRRAGGAGRALFEPFLQRLRDLGTPGLLLSGSKQEGPLLGSQVAAPQPPGRGLLVSRQQQPSLVQLAWAEVSALQQ